MNIKSISFPSTVHEIGYAFCENYNPREISFSEGLEKIGGRAFMSGPFYDTNPLIIPSTVTYIGQWCFRDYQSTAYIKYGTATYTEKCVIMKPTVPPTISWGSFCTGYTLPRPASTQQQSTDGYPPFFFVPDESVDTYKTATNWTVYADWIRPLSQYHDGYYENDTYTLPS